MIVRKKFTFEAAHRLPKHGGRCSGLHGHSYKVEVFLEGDVDPATGMVIDFGHIKNLLGSMIDRFDHSLIVSRDDTIGGEDLLTHLNKRYMIVPYHPTAEMMAAHFFYEFVNILENHTPIVARVRVWETETGWAECDTILDINFADTVYSKGIWADQR